jgi:hypothetical protein
MEYNITIFYVWFVFISKYYEHRWASYQTRAPASAQCPTSHHRHHCVHLYEMKGLHPPYAKKSNSIYPNPKAGRGYAHTQPHLTGQPSPPCTGAGRRPAHTRTDQATQTECQTYQASPEHPWYAQRTHKSYTSVSPEKDGLSG